MPEGITEITYSHLLCDRRKSLQIARLATPYPHILPSSCFLEFL